MDKIRAFMVEEQERARSAVDALLSINGYDREIVDYFLTRYGMLCKLIEELDTIREERDEQE